MKKIGHVKDAHGLRGELIIHVPAADITWANSLSSVSLQDPSTSAIQIFSLESCKPHKSGLRLKLKEISDRTQAEQYRGWGFLIAEDLLVSQPGETIFLAEILNFEVKQASGESWGIITGFSTNGVQDLLQIQNQKGVFEAPFVADFIVDIDFKNKVVTMNLPEGLQD